MVDRTGDRSNGLPRAADVFLHVGLPKSGTSFLQHALWGNREALARTGVLIPGEGRVSHMLAVWDLMGRRPRDAEMPQVPGSWPALVASVQDWPGSHALISEEFLALANPRQARRAVRAFGEDRIHVVVTIRDLGRVISSTWQQNLQKGRTWSWEEFLTAVREPDRGKATAGAVFWLRQDVVRVLDVWETAVPREHIHLVTVPPSGAPPRLLLERFAEVTGLDPTVFDDDLPVDNNVSVGVAEAEVLRRLNAGLAGRLNERQYRRVVHHGIRPALAARQSPTRIQLPTEHRAWVTERASAMVEVLRERGYHVAGDLDDLLPCFSDARSRPDEVADAAIADAAIAALVSTSEQYGRYWWRTRRRDRPTPASGGARVGSLARAAGFRARMAALDLADQHPLVDRVAARYLRRSGR